MPRNSKNLRRRLHQSGYCDAAISAAWPGWWSDEAEDSVSAQVELRFSLARKLGLDPRSLLEDDEPAFVWKGEAKFKHLKSESEAERTAMSSYGIAIGRMLVSATPGAHSLHGTDPRELRAMILATKTFIGLQDLLGLCWGVGIPVIHLRVFPLAAKRMCAMSSRAGDRFSILLGKDAEYPPSLAFYLAHEIGHIALGHLQEGAALVDMSDPFETKDENDEEEKAADRFALELLTGQEKPKIDTPAHHFTAKQLADNLLQTGPQTRIEPGTLALCYGYSSGDWAKTNAAMKSIYARALPVWQEVNRVAQSQMDWDAIPEDLAFFLRAVIGCPQG